MLNFIRNHWIATVIILSAVWGILSFSSQSDSNTNGREKLLIVGLQSEYPPFEYVDASGNLIGFDLDVARVLAEKLHRKLVVKPMKFELLITELKQGKIDLVMSGMNITHNRLEEIAMVPYHGSPVNSLRLLFWNEVPEGIKSIRDIASLPTPVISVEAGTVCETVLEKYKDIKFKTFQGALDPLMDVRLGNSAATLVQPDVAEYLQEQYPDVQSLRVPLDQEQQLLGFGIGIKKSHALLVHQVLEAIEGLRNSGTLRQIESKWFKEEFRK